MGKAAYDSSKRSSALVTAGQNHNWSRCRAVAAHLVRDEELWQFGTGEQGTAVVRAPGVRCHHSDSHGVEMTGNPGSSISRVDIDEDRGDPQ